MNYISRFAGHRLVCWIVSIALVLTMVPSVSTTAGAYANTLPLPVLTGNKAQDTANIALSQLGYDEGWDGGTLFGAWWNSQIGWTYDYTYAGWCAMFACWCANQAGAGMGIAFDENSASPAYLLSWLRQNAWVDTSFSTKPQPGDFIFFGYGQYAEHIAVVVDYDSATNTVTFVGGNQSDSVTKCSLEWSRRGYYGDQNIVGYGRPNYSQVISAPAKPNINADRGVYFSGTEVTLSWNNVAGAANYAVEIYRNGQLYYRDFSVDLSWFTLSQCDTGTYIVHVTARNCVGNSPTASYTFNVIESMPNIPVWVTDSTLQAAEENAKINLFRQDISIVTEWYSQIDLPNVFR